jgi:hypothetical protein
MPLKECDVFRNEHVPGKVTRMYASDKSGTVLYEFNSKGYRGEEYDSAAKFRICVIGESYAFGVGIPLEETFAYKLKQHISASLTLHLDEINLINLSVSGASADYCVRTIYRQLSDCRVDLLVCHFPELARIEYIAKRGYRMYNVGSALKNLSKAPISLLGYCDYYDHNVGKSNQLKNALLAQAFLKERKIDYILATQDLPRTRQDFVYLEDYFDRVDASAVLWHKCFRTKADLAADGVHSGPRCHAAFAIEVLSLFGHMQLERGQEHRGRRIANYGSRLRATDEDWRYVKSLDIEVS